MLRILSPSVSLLAILMFVGSGVPSATGQPPLNYQLEKDWLLDSAPFEAVCRVSDEADTITLTNGLIRRTLRLEPAVASVSFDNLMTGASLLRAVGCEGYVTIDGTEFRIGGLEGQPNRAFIRPEWLAELQPVPNALELVGHRISEPQPRFAWKRTRHHAADAPWPPPGVALHLDFKIPEEFAASQLAAGWESTLGRRQLVSWSAGEPLGAWEIRAGEANRRSKVWDPEEPGTLQAPANTCVFIERPVPPQTRLVETALAPETDAGASWGPGITLVWPDRRVKFYIRAGEGNSNTGTLALWDGSREKLRLTNPISIDRSKTSRLRIRWDGRYMSFEAKSGQSNWQFVERIPLDRDVAPPSRVRIGKTSKTGGSNDYSGDSGELGEFRVLSFQAYGPLDSNIVDQNLASLRDLRISLHYQLYDGIPLLSKWITVHNDSSDAITVDRFTAEELSLVEQGTRVETRTGVPLPHPDYLHVETDMAFGGFTHQNSNRHAVHWRTEPEYSTQVNYRLQTPCRLVVEPTYGPAQKIQPGEVFESFRVFELVYDAQQRERRSLALRQMYRTIAPWVTENPLMMHMRTADPSKVRRAIDQCAEVGFEMLILSFGSGFNAENDDPAYLRQWKEIADEAHRQGVQIGCYSLLSSRRVAEEHMIVSPPGQTPTHGQCPALTSEWGQDYFRKLRNLFRKTGFDLLEHDGSYPGDVDVTSRPPLQTGLQDSRWAQWRIISDFYKWMRGRGTYLNVPDYYYLVGSNKCGMGYRETNWSLPREQQRIHTRQNIYDGTWTKTPSMGWMFVPLTTYHGGGAAATIEPLDRHRDHYRVMMNSNLAFGVQACYRGPRLYDTDRTKRLVQQRVAWFKQYRDILESDVLHGRRADGRDLDWMLHVNPNLARRGMLVIFNPTDHEIRKDLRVPLYYTGLRDRAVFFGPDQSQQLSSQTVELDRNEKVTLSVAVPPHGFQWYVVRKFETNTRSP